MSSTTAEGAMAASAPAPRKRRMLPSQRHNLTGWVFLIPAALLILITSFWPMFEALLLSMQTGKGTNLNWAEPLWYNYARLFQDTTFKLTLGNTFVYLIIQVPIMLVLALVLANLLNNPNRAGRGCGARPSSCRVPCRWCRTRWCSAPCSPPTASSTTC